MCVTANRAQSGAASSSQTGDALGKALASVSTAHSHIQVLETCSVLESGDVLNTVFEASKLRRRGDEDKKLDESAKKCAVK